MNMTQMVKLWKSAAHSTIKYMRSVVAYYQPDQCYVSTDTERIQQEMFRLGHFDENGGELGNVDWPVL